MKVVAAILAAGRGERFGGDKTQILLMGKPLWRWSFETFRCHPRVDGVGLVASPENREALSAASGALFVVAGGATRTDSSAAALAAVPDDTDIVLIHDAARPFVADSVITDVIEAAARSGAAAPGIPVTDTIKLVRDGSVQTLDRRELVAMQTPQGARREILQRAFAATVRDATDDMQLMEAIGITPEIVAGDPANLKITRPEDVRRYGRNESDVRTGMGYDVHPFSSDPGRPLMLGGVHFEGSCGLEGHSDADVLLHAVVDALLGAAGLGDIGQHFPNSDSCWKDASSTLFLRHAGQLLKDEGWRVQNVDVTVIAEQPRVMARSADICGKIAAALETDVSRVNVKATTNERLGFIGRGEGIAAMAIATLTTLGMEVL